MNTTRFPAGRCDSAAANRLLRVDQPRSEHIQQRGDAQRSIVLFRRLSRFVFDIEEILKAFIQSSPESQEVVFSAMTEEYLRQVFSRSRSLRLLMGSLEDLLEKRRGMITEIHNEGVPVAAAREETPGASPVPRAEIVPEVPCIPQIAAPTYELRSMRGYVSSQRGTELGLRLVQFFFTAWEAEANLFAADGLRRAVAGSAIVADADVLVREGLLAIRSLWDVVPARRVVNGVDFHNMVYSFRKSKVGDLNFPAFVRSAVRLAARRERVSPFIDLDFVLNTA